MLDAVHAAASIPISTEMARMILAFPHGAARRPIVSLSPLEHSLGLAHPRGLRLPANLCRDLASRAGPRGAGSAHQQPQLRSPLSTAPLRLRAEPPGGRLSQSVYRPIMNDLLRHPHGLVHRRPPQPHCLSASPSRSAMGRGIGQPTYPERTDPYLRSPMEGAKDQSRLLARPGPAAAGS